MAKNIIIGCKLPHGIILEHPKDPKKKVEIKGLNSIVIIGADHYRNEVDADFWADWKAFHTEFPAVKSGAIFEASSVADADAKAKELKGEETGFEHMKQEAMGVKPTTND